MALPIDQLTRPVTSAQAKQAIYDMLAKSGLPVTSWRRGAIVRTIVAVVAYIVAGFTQLLAVVVKGLFLSTAAGVWLTLLAQYVYGVVRRSATFAQGQITFDNTGGGEFNLAIGEVVVYNETTGKRYTNIEAFTLASLETGKKVAFQAVEAGSASTSTPGTITAFATPLSDVTCTNEAAFVGSDEQSDEELRQDCVDALGALSPFGAPGAYAYFAKHVPGGQPLTRADGSAIEVNRVQVKATNNTGSVSVWVASSSGPLSGDDLTIVTNNVLKYATPQCVTVSVLNATEVPVDIQYAVYADAGADKTTDEVKATIDAAVTAYGAVFPIGGQKAAGPSRYLFANKVRGVVVEADPAILTASLTTPSADVLLSDGEIPTFTISGLSTVDLVAQ